MQDMYLPVHKKFNVAIGCQDTHQSMQLLLQQMYNSVDMYARNKLYCYMVKLQFFSNLLL